MTIVDQWASAAQDQILSGLSGFEATLNLNIEELKDTLIQTRASILHKYALKNLLPLKELYMSINCVELKCGSISKCCQSLDFQGDSVLHFEIPQIFTPAGDEAIQYIGSIDKQRKFKVYTSPQAAKAHKYRVRGKDKPYVYLDTTPNKNNNIDGYVFNAPLLETLSITAIFKDPRDLEQFACCDYDMENWHNLSPIDIEVIDTVVAKYIKYFRQLYMPSVPNDQVPK